MKRRVHESGLERLLTSRSNIYGGGGFVLYYCGYCNVLYGRSYNILYGGSYNILHGRNYNEQRLYY